MSKRSSAHIKAQRAGQQEIMEPVRLAAQSRKFKDITYLTISFQEQQQKILSRYATTVTRRFITVNWTSANFKNIGGRKNGKI